MVKKKNIAYVDGVNLHKGVQELGWQLDYSRFRIWLREKFGAEKAYLFIGFIPKFKDLYVVLQEAGFMLVFKETVHDGSGNIKGNCDAELVLAVVRDAYEQEFERAILVTGDGDFGCLASFLLDRKQLRATIAPNSKKCSFLIRRIQAPLVFLNGLQKKLGK